MFESLKARLESAKKAASEEMARVQNLMKKCEQDFFYLKGHHDALDAQLQQLATDVPLAVVDTAAAVAADSAAAGQSGANLAADVAAVQSTETAVKADAKVADDVVSTIQAVSATSTETK